MHSARRTRSISRSPDAKEGTAMTIEGVIVLIILILFAMWLFQQVRR